MKKKICSILSVLSALCVLSQNPLYTNVPVSDIGNNNNIGNANTSRNISVDKLGNIYVAFTGSEGIRVAKSIDRGQTFSASVQITPVIAEPEIAVNEEGIIFIAWMENLSIFLSRSVDGGNSFSAPTNIGTGSISFDEGVHMSTYGANVYIIDTPGANLFYNNTNGVGSFNLFSLPTFVFADVISDQNGALFTPRDNPTLELYKSEDFGQNFNQIPLNPNSEQVFYSSYTFSDGPCGSFIFVAGEGTLGYKIDVTDGTTTEINFQNNTLSVQGRTLYSDNQGTLIDGYRDNNGDLMMSISSDQGQNFNAPINIVTGQSHNIGRNTFNNDIVVVYEQNGRIFLSVYDDILKSVQINEPDPPLSMCLGESFDLPFTLTGNFSTNTIFSAVLSDADGDFSNSIEIGSLTIIGNTGIIQCTLPTNIANSENYRIIITSLSDCVQSSPIPIIIGNIVATQPENLSECDLGNGTANFDLTSNEATIVNGQSDYQITYHYSELDAQNTNDPIANPDNLSSSGETIWVRLQNTTSANCFDITSFDLILFELPQITTPITLEQCDPDSDGIASFNLLEANNLIVVNTQNLTFTYYLTQVQAENGLVSDQIVNTMTYSNPAPINSIVYVRVENDNECYRVAQINLFAETSQHDSFNFTPDILEECEIDNNGIDLFDLTRIEEDILNLADTNPLNDLDPLNYTFTYYGNNADAILIPEDTNLALNNPDDFENTLPFTQDIYLRITPVNNNQCPKVIAFTLQVNNAPQINILPEYVICLDGNSNVIAPTTPTTIANTIIDTELDASNYSFQWHYGTEQEVIDNPTTTIIPGETLSTFLPDIQGYYTVIATSIASGCTIPATTFVYESYPPESILISTTSLAFSENKNLEVIVTGNGEYEYKLDDGNWQTSNMFLNVTGGEKTIYIRDVFHCGLILATEIIIDYPKFFTPNDDNYNNNWNIKGISGLSNPTIYIFDRYGKLLKQLNPSGNGWDGTYNGLPMPTNDYWFTIEFNEPSDNTKRVFKAHFSLKR